MEVGCVLASAIYSLKGPQRTGFRSCGIPNLVDITFFKSFFDSQRTDFNTVRLTRLTHIHVSHFGGRDDDEFGASSTKITLVKQSVWNTGFDYLFIDLGPPSPLKKNNYRDITKA
jgi:hypothetical protein